AGLLGNNGGDNQRCCGVPTGRGGRRQGQEQSSGSEVGSRQCCHQEPDPHPHPREHQGFAGEPRGRGGCSS
ncbi:unnamed protein product, partial [Musa banksii]